MLDSNVKFKDFEQITETNKMATAVALDQRLCYFKYCFYRKEIRQRVRLKRANKKIEFCKIWLENKLTHI